MAAPPLETSRGRRGLTLFSEIGGLVTFIVFLVGVVVSNSVRGAVADGGRWLWPTAVVAILSAAVIVMAVLLVRAQRRKVDVPVLPPRPEDRAFDRDAVQDLKRSLPRETITWLKEHDFGGSWDHDEMRPLDFMAHERDEVEHRFHDTELEHRRARLLAAINVLRREADQRAGVDHRGRYSISAWDDAPSHRSDEERAARKQESRTTLNAAADDVVNGYDAVLERARELGVLEAPRSWAD